MLRALIILTLCSFFSLNAAIKSSTGTIVFESGSNLYLNSTGLGIGAVATSSNLYVSGNAYISNSLTIGSSAGSSNLNITGTLGLSYQNVTGNITLSENSLYLCDSSAGNLNLTLPYAGNVRGRKITIKNITANNHLWIRGGLIDYYDSNYLQSAGSSYPSLTLISENNNWYVLNKIETLTQSVVSSSNLKAWYRMDDSSQSQITDTFGNSHGTLSYTPGSNIGTDGYLGKSINFDAISGQYATVVNNSPGDIDQYLNYTLSAWVYRTGTDEMYVYVNSAIRYGIKSNGVQGNQVMTDTGTIYPQSSTTVPLNKWAFIGITYDGTNVIFYYNGISDGTAAKTGTPNTGTSVYIGARDTSWYPFGGRIDDLRVYNKALSASEMLELYESAAY